MEEISLSLYDMNTGEDITANVCGLNGTRRVNCNGEESVNKTRAEMKVKRLKND